MIYLELPTSVFNSLEATLVSIKINGKPYTLVSAYKSPTNHLLIMILNHY